MTPPLANIRVIVHANGVAAAYAGRMLATLGASVTLVEPEGGTPLRREAPFLPGSETSATFAYLTTGMARVTGDPRDHLSSADVFIDDTPIGERPTLGLDEAAIAASHPNLIHVSTLPFGSFGPKAEWKGEEINVLHASGEGYLLPNGLTTELFPDRPPVKVHGHFTEMQGGTAAALGALSALWARGTSGGQYVDVSSQDAGLSVGAFAIQRLGDGSVEHRVERSFRFGGVIECADGFVELLTLEQRQWDGLVDLLGNPDWAQDPDLADSVARSRRGPEINRHIRVWAKTRRVDEVVSEGQKRSVPLARYYTPNEVLADPHEASRGLFQKVQVPGAGVLPMLVSPFHFDGRPLVIPPQNGEGDHAKHGGGAQAGGPALSPSESPARTPPPPSVAPLPVPGRNA